MNSKPRFLASVFFVCVLVLAGCSRVETPKPTPVPVRIRIAADDATESLLRKLTQTYAVLNPNIEFEVQQGSATSISEMMYLNKADLISISRLPDAMTNRPKPWVGDLAVDGVAVVVNVQNPVSSLTLQDLRDIFSGVRGDWGDFGIPGRGIISVLLREDGEGARLAFDKSVMGDMGLSKSGIVLSSFDSVMNYVGLVPDAVGYIPASRLGKLPPNIKPIGIEGQIPSSDVLTQGGYRIVRTLNLCAAREPQRELRDFVAWVLGAEGQRVVASLGFVPVGATK